MKQGPQTKTLVGFKHERCQLVLPGLSLAEFLDGLLLVPWTILCSMLVKGWSGP